MRGPVGVLPLLSCICVVNAFSWSQPARSPIPNVSDNKNENIIVNEIGKIGETAEESPLHRRSFLNGLATAFLGTTTPLVLTRVDANAVIMDSKNENTKIFKAGQPMSKDFALERFQLGRKDLAYLLDHYDAIALDGGGDNLRRYLGTVGVTSGLYGITRVMKELQEYAEDIVEYTENMNDFDSYLRAADTACYSANFVEFSAANTKPEKFFEDAKQDAKNMSAAMERMAKEIGI